MAKTCITEKTASRQRWIENGLLELMLERRFEDISVTELCTHLSLSRRSFYRYFSDLEDVLDSLMNHTMQDMAIIHAAPTIADLKVYCQFWLQRKDLLSALSRSDMHSKLVRYTMQYAGADTILQNLSPEDLDANLGPEINLFVISGLSSLLLSWHREGFRRSAEEMARIAMRLLFKPLLSNP